jgi:hypothetical protein
LICSASGEVLSTKAMSTRRLMAAGSALATTRKFGSFFRGCDENN